MVMMGMDLWEGEGGNAKQEEEQGEKKEGTKSEGDG